MGKGDMKTRRGKISRGTYGKKRPRKVVKATNTQAAQKVKKK